MKLAFAAEIFAISLLAAGPLAAAGAITLNPPPPAGYQGQWYTTPGGCSYSRGQAPGYAPTWHLIWNPHHIGKPNANKRCPLSFGVKG